MIDGGQPRVSDREAEVLALIRSGASNQQISHRLRISVRTVESHVSSLLRKYGVADRQALASIAPADPAMDGGVVRLPRPRTSFVGRTAELQWLGRELRDAGLVTLLGAGGVGKTRLATAAAGTFPHGGAFVDLVPVRGEFVVQAVAAVLGVAESPTQPLWDAVAERLGHGRSLLILDNCEHLVDAAAGFAQRLLAACPDATVLATSRERLGVPGERVLPLPPLSTDAEAQELFRQRALAADPSFTAGDDELDRLCVRLDRVPLAIELAAARTAALGADGLLVALDDSLRVLAGGRDVDERHRSLRAVLDWSHGLLVEDERRLFRRLGVFAGVFDLTAAAAVTGGDRAAAADVLGRLVDKSLVVRVPGEARWRLLDTVRIYAVEQLVAGGEAELVREWHLRWASATAGRLVADLNGRWADEFDVVADDLRAAVAAVPAGPHPLAHDLARALGHLCYARRFLGEAIDHYVAAAARAPAPASAADDLGDAAACVEVLRLPGRDAIDLLVRGADLAAAAGDGNRRAVLLSRAVEFVCRSPALFPDPVPTERVRAWMAAAETAGDPCDPVVAARVAIARAFAAGPGPSQPDADLARAALERARAAGDPVVLSAAIAQMSSVLRREGRLAEYRVLNDERSGFFGDLDQNDPAAGPEVQVVLQMAVHAPVILGDLTGALAAARWTREVNPQGRHSPASTSEQAVVEVLLGRFDDAMRHGDEMWDAWVRSGRRPAGWLTSPVALLALAYGLIDDPEAFRRWRSRMREVAGIPADRPFAIATGAFVDARFALHRLDGGAPPEVAGPALVAAAFAPYPGSFYGGYAAAAGAELAVATGQPDAPDRLAAAEFHAGNAWVAAALARARGRLTASRTLLTEAAERWEAIGAGFEREATLALLDGRAGRAPDPPVH